MARAAISAIAAVRPGAAASALQRRDDVVTDCSARDAAVLDADCRTGQPADVAVSAVASVTAIPADDVAIGAEPTVAAAAGSSALAANSVGDGAAVHAGAAACRDVHADRIATLSASASQTTEAAVAGTACADTCFRAVAAVAAVAAGAASASLDQLDAARSNGRLAEGDIDARGTATALARVSETTLPAIVACAAAARGAGRSLRSIGPDGAGDVGHRARVHREQCVRVVHANTDRRWLTGGRRRSCSAPARPGRRRRSCPGRRSNQGLRVPARPSRHP